MVNKDELIKLIDEGVALLTLKKDLLNRMTTKLVNARKKTTKKIKYYKQLKRVVKHR